MEYGNLQYAGREADHDHVVVTLDHEGLRDILAPDVLAVLLVPQQRPAWIEELESAVSTAKFVLSRLILADATVDEVAASVETQLDVAPLSSQTKKSLCEDLISLACRCGDLTGARRFRFRFFTDVPNCRCSYHVDTVPPGVATTALIRVYCGARTEYVMPSNLTCWEDFYSYVFRREQQIKAITAARAICDSAAEATANVRLARMEERPPFLIQPGAAEIVPRDALVACKFVDSYYLWNSTYVHTRSARAWIHRSPMVGEPRFVATVNAVA